MMKTSDQMAVLFLIGGVMTALSSIVLFGPLETIFGVGIFFVYTALR